MAQLHGVYILAENQHGMVLVDMHAAHERITYERLKQAREGAGITRQPLLVPITLAVSNREAAIAAEQAEELASLGVLIEAVGEEAVVCRELPAPLKDADAEALVRDVCVRLVVAPVKVHVRAKAVVHVEAAPRQRVAGVGRVQHQ